MKTFLVRLLLTLVGLYVLAVAAYAFLHYSSEERPDVLSIAGEFNADFGALFKRKPPPAQASEGGATTGASALDRLRSHMTLDLDLTMDLAQVIVPETSAHLQAEAAALWDALRPIHDQTLPQGIDDLGRLRLLKTSDPAAFPREREAARARLAPARVVLVQHAQPPNPWPAAVKMLDVLDRLDQRLAGL